MHIVEGNIISMPFIKHFSELGIDYVAPEDHVVSKPSENGTVNGHDIKKIIDPYDELIKNHLQKEEKIKVRVKTF